MIVAWVVVHGTRCNHNEREHGRCAAGLHEAQPGFFKNLLYWILDLDDPAIMDERRRAHA